ncbi:MAG: hypothetical protein ACXU8N_06245 [Telluria sp.]
MTRLLLLLALAAALPARAAPPQSPLARELNATFQRMNGDVVMPAWPLARQLGELFGGPPEAPLQLPGGLLLEAACRLHSCDEKGAVVTDTAARQVVAIAARHFRCHAGSSGGTQCDHGATLTIWVPRHGHPAENEAAAIAALRAWGRAAGYSNEETRYVASALR